MALRRLPCGGSVTTSDDGAQQNRILRGISDNQRKAVFILAHPYAIRGEKPGIEEAWCVKFCERHGYGELCILYLFPYCVTSISELNSIFAPWGPGPINRRIQDIEIDYTHGGIVIAAWDDAGTYRGADKMLLRRFDGTPKSFSPWPSRATPIHILGMTPAGNPISVLSAAPDALPSLHPNFVKAAA